MSNENNAHTVSEKDSALTVKICERPALVKRIGKTTYRVYVHFSTTSTETMSDKIRRMIRNEVQQEFCK